MQSSLFAAHPSKINDLEGRSRAYSELVAPILGPFSAVQAGRVEQLNWTKQSAYDTIFSPFFVLYNLIFVLNLQVEQISTIFRLFFLYCKNQTKVGKAGQDHPLGRVSPMQAFPLSYPIALVSSLDYAEGLHRLLPRYVLYPGDKHVRSNDFIHTDGLVVG